MVDLGIPQSTTFYTDLLFLLFLAITENPSVRMGNSGEGRVALQGVNML